MQRFDRPREMENPNLSLNCARLKALWNRVDLPTAVTPFRMTSFGFDEGRRYVTIVSFINEDVK